MRAGGRYAFAMIAFELFEGYIPFQGEKPILAAKKAAMEHVRPGFGAQNRCDAARTHAWGHCTFKACCHASCTTHDR